MDQTEEKTITVTSNDLENIFDKILGWGLPILVFALPLIFIPVNADSFDLPKQIFALTGALFLLTILLFKAFIKGKLAFLRSPLNLPIILLPVAAIISQIFNTSFTSVTHFMTVFFLPLLSLTLIFFLVTIAADDENKAKKVFNGALLSALVMALWSTLGFILFLLNKIPVMNEVFSKIPSFLLTFLSPGFSFTGSVFSQIFWSAMLLPVLILNRKTRWYLPTLMIVIIGLVVNLFTIYVSRPIFLSIFDSWKIATGVLSISPQAAIFGMGMDNFANAFTAFRSTSLNSGPLWNLRFSIAGNYYLQILTTMGMAGLAALALLAVRFFKIFQLRQSLGVVKSWENGLLYAVAGTLAAFLILPAPFIVQFLTFVMLGLLVVHYRQNEVTALASEKNLPFAGFTKFAVVSVTTLLMAASIYFGYRHLLFADYLYSESFRQAAANKGAETYNLQIRAIDLNPWKDSYHLAFSQTNLALADSLAGQGQQGENKLTDAQKNTITQLVQQAIREGRTAAAVNPGNSADWENLTVIYRSLISFAQGADQWALGSQNQAVALDPTNPRLRLDLGGLYFTLGNYNAAAQAFSAAAQLKPDYANAHYNLAQAYKKLGGNDLAMQELTAVRDLVCINADSEDCKKIEQELAEKPPVAKTASESAVPTNLNKTKTTPPAKISSPSGELNP